MATDIHNIQEHNQAEPCEQWRSLLTLFSAGDELETEDHARVAAHVASCPACAAAVEQERELVGFLAGQHRQPDAALLASCRAGLQDALDHQEEIGWFGRLFASFLPSNWLSPQPSWGAAVLLLFGFGIGVLAPRFIARNLEPNGHIANPGNSSVADSLHPAASSSSLDDSNSGPIPPALDLRTADVAGINVLNTDGNRGDPGLPNVELQLRSQRPVSVTGSVDNEQVKHLLLDVLSDGAGDRFCPDLRLDAVDCLKARKNDPQIRAALCSAARTDQNAAVRLKAIEALDGAEPQNVVQQTLLDALVDDQNPGVRVEAVNALRDLAAKGQVGSDDSALSVLKDRMQNDPNTYIRLQSAAAVRDISYGPHQ